MRRKTVGNSLCSGLAQPKARIMEALRDAGVGQDLRAEQLSIEQFAALAEVLEKAGIKG